MTLEAKQLIAGAWRDAEGGTRGSSINPADASAIGQYAAGGRADAQAAIAAARRAFDRPDWAQAPRLRQQVMLQWADALERKADELARLLTLENGKVLAQSHGEIGGAISEIRYYAGLARFIPGHVFEVEPGVFSTLLKEPAGVAGLIIPWNAPVVLLIRALTPALAAGCTVVAKPSEVTPLTAHMLAERCIEAGLPPGVLNIVHGLGPKVGAAITAHPRIPAISFTGGTKTGAEIARVAAPMFKKLSLELGGKNAVLVFADCDFDRMLANTVRSSFRNQGQICLCGSRILVERSIYDRFRDAFVARTKALRVGDPSAEDTDLGAVVSEGHMNKVLGHIAIAQEEGGRVLCGGRRVRLEGELREGWYIAPTVIEGLGPQCRTNQEEIFGPVVTLQPFDTEEEALSLANATPYGLASVLWTSDTQRTHRVARALNSGIVWVNCWMVRDLRTPFGGMKQSGVGREGGVEALRFFTEAKNVCIRL